MCEIVDDRLFQASTSVGGSACPASPKSKGKSVQNLAFTMNYKLSNKKFTLFLDICI